jgi:hypothetical protein
MTGDTTPALVHPLLGSLRWLESGELAGSVEIEPSISPPRASGRRDAELALHVPAALSGEALNDHVGRCAIRIRDALARLDSLTDFTAEHAPDSWQAQYPAGSETRATVLFLDGVEVDQDLKLTLVFDFGDLDQLVTRLDDQGNAAVTQLRP